MKIKEVFHIWRNGTEYTVSSYRFLSRCDSDVNECVAKGGPCQNGGVCVNVPGSFRCVCPDEFTGELCESFRLITCENDPCKNGATCIDVPNPITENNFTCTCMPGFDSPTCDTPYCITKKCQNSGRCDFLYQVIVCTYRNFLLGEFRKDWTQFFFQTRVNLIVKSSKSVFRCVVALN